MPKKEIEIDPSKVSKKLEEAVGGLKAAEEVKMNSNKFGFTKC